MPNQNVVTPIGVGQGRERIARKELETNKIETIRELKKENYYQAELIATQERQLSKLQQNRTVEVSQQYGITGG